MEFESVETQMLSTTTAKIEKIVPVVRNDAHKLIEECMLAANVCAAEFLMKNKHTALFRNHLGPTPEKLATLREQLAYWVCVTGRRRQPDAERLCRTCRTIQRQTRCRIAASHDAALHAAGSLRTALRRTLGLAYEAYAHFTSPSAAIPT